MKTGISVGLVSTILLAGCADFVTPVAVLPTKAKYEGIEPTQFGIACAKRVLWIFTYGDSYVGTAKKQGNISDIETVEVTKTVFLADYFPFDFYKAQCTEVTGY